MRGEGLNVGSLERMPGGKGYMLGLTLCIRSQVRVGQSAGRGYKLIRAEGAPNHVEGGTMAASKSDIE